MEEVVVVSLEVVVVLEVVVLEVVLEMVAEVVVKVGAEVVWAVGAVVGVVVVSVHPFCAIPHLGVVPQQRVTLSSSHDPGADQQ